MKITREHMEHAWSDEDDIWSFGKQILYDLCSKYPEHTDPKVITAKIWLIGRSHAAAIERRKSEGKEKEDVDTFYEKDVVPTLMSSEIDAKIRHLRKYQQVEDQSLEDILKTHKYLVICFHQLTGQNNRSLASKYLHFHLPNLFYIYDSWAEGGFRILKPRYRTSRRIPECVDETYARFVLKLLDLTEEVQQDWNHRLAPRQIDRLLLKRWSEKHGAS